MRQIIKTNEWGRTDVFEIVEAVPAGFKVWNIGDHAPAGYVPPFIRTLIPFSVAAI